MRGRTLAAAVALLMVGCGEGSASPFATTPASTPTTTTTAPPTTSTTTPSSATTATEAPPQLEAVCLDAACRDTPIDYLIVTRPLFVDALSEFATWKTNAGFDVGIVTVDWLSQTYEGDHLAEQMKTGMHDIRRSATGDGTIYALLVGDTEIPTDDFRVEAVLASYDLDVAWNTPTGFYRRIDNDPAGEVLASDAYFVEDADWDVTGSGLNEVGGPNGQGTMVPTIYLGRWPARSPSDLEPIISKTMQVAPASSILQTQDAEFLQGEGCCNQWPPNDEWFGYGTRACCYLDTTEISQRILAETSWIESTEHAVPMQGAELSDFDPLWAADGVVLFSYHGWYDCVQLQEGSCNGIADFAFEQVFPLFEASSCYIAAFYSGSTPTLSESLFSLETGPAMFSQAGHNSFQFIDGLRQGMPVGDAFWAPAQEYVYWLNPILLLGDPSLQVLAGPS